MPRARNLKYQFFTNDEVAELEPIERLFFMALWCLADYKGDIEWREKKIKILTLPYDDVDVKKIAINLDKSGLVRMYVENGKMYLNITNFIKHQNPHKNERDKGSDIPCFNEKSRQLIDFNTLTINPDKNGTTQDKDETNRADSLSLNPDSLNPIPESCILKPDIRDKEKKQDSSKNELSVDKKKTKVDQVFEYWKKILNHPRAVLDDKRKRIITKALKNYSVNDCKSAIKGCLLTPHNMGKNDNHKIYDGIHIIFRDADNIERFISSSNPNQQYETHINETEKLVARLTGGA